MLRMPCISLLLWDSFSKDCSHHTESFVLAQSWVQTVLLLVKVFSLGFLESSPTPFSSWCLHDDSRSHGGLVSMTGTVVLTLSRMSRRSGLYHGATEISRQAWCPHCRSRTESAAYKQRGRRKSLRARGRPEPPGVTISYTDRMSREMRLLID